MDGSLVLAAFVPALLLAVLRRFPAREGILRMREISLQVRVRLRQLREMLSTRVGRDGEVSTMGERGESELRRALDPDIAAIARSPSRLRLSLSGERDVL